MTQFMGALLGVAVMISASCYAVPREDTATDSTAVASSFLPIWKLLSYDQKVQFVSGYIQGWKDAARVTDVAISYVRDNPKNAVDGLEKLRSLYDLSDLKPSTVVDHIDSFYADPDNSEAALSLAVSASRALTLSAARGK